VGKGGRDYQIRNEKKSSCWTEIKERVPVKMVDPEKEKNKGRWQRKRKKPQWCWREGIKPAGSYDERGGRLVRNEVDNVVHYETRTGFDSIVEKKHEFVLVYDGGGSNA